MRKPLASLLIGTAVLLALIWFYFPTLSKYRDLKLEEERISKELADLDVKVKALEEERHLLKNDVEYLEKVIRQELGLVKPGEVVYKFVEEERIEEETSPVETESQGPTTQ